MGIRRWRQVQRLDDDVWARWSVLKESSLHQGSLVLSQFHPHAVNIGLMSATAQLSTGSWRAFYEAARIRYLGGNFITFSWQPLRISLISSYREAAMAGVTCFTCSEYNFLKVCTCNCVSYWSKSSRVSSSPVGLGWQTDAQLLCAHRYGGGDWRRGFHLKSGMHVQL